MFNYITQQNTHAREFNKKEIWRQKTSTKTEYSITFLRLWTQSDTFYLCVCVIPNHWEKRLLLYLHQLYKYNVKKWTLTIKGHWAGETNDSDIISDEETVVVFVNCEVGTCHGDLLRFIDCDVMGTHHDINKTSTTMKS